MLIKSASSSKVSLISVLHGAQLNGAKFLNTTCVACVISILLVLALFLFLTAISPVTKIYASE